MRQEDKGKFVFLFVFFLFWFSIFMDSYGINRIVMKKIIETKKKTIALKKTKLNVKI